MKQFTSENMPDAEKKRWLENHLPYRIQILKGLSFYNENNGCRNHLLRPLHPSIFEATLVQSSLYRKRISPA